MKSLEIVTKRVNYYNEGVRTIHFRIEDMLEIQKDLEVLEILQVLILHNGKSVGYKGIISDFEVMFRLGKITKEQLDKLKKWLEENQW